jgi:S1-C subfamily serine protease
MDADFDHLTNDGNGENTDLIGAAQRAQPIVQPSPPPIIMYQEQPPAKPNRRLFLKASGAGVVAGIVGGTIVHQNKRIADLEQREDLVALIKRVRPSVVWVQQTFPLPPDIQTLQEKLKRLEEYMNQLPPSGEGETIPAPQDALPLIPPQQLPPLPEIDDGTKELLKSMEKGFKEFFRNWSADQEATPDQSTHGISDAKEDELKERKVVGAGFVLNIGDNQFIATNGHNIWEEGMDIRNLDCSVIGSVSPIECPTKPLSLAGGQQAFSPSHEYDLALMEVPKNLQFQQGVTIGLNLRNLRTHPLQAGEKIVAIGNPFGTRGAVTEGIISKTNVLLSDHSRDASFAQTSANLNPGNSGGPVVDMQGRVVGIATAISGEGAGVGFILRADTIEERIRQWNINMQKTQKPVSTIESMMKSAMKRIGL